MTATDRTDPVESEIAARLRAAPVALDEVHRARLSAAIEAALDRAPRSRLSFAISWRRGVWMAGAFACCAAAVLAGRAVLRRGPASSGSTPFAPATTAEARRVPALLVPHVPSGQTVRAAAASLLASKGERVRATLGSRVRLTLIGPGRVSVLPEKGTGELDLALDGGRLLVDYDGHAGGLLRVRSPGAVTTVVGTLFAVDVTPFGSRVAVAHGRVRTQDSSGRVWQVAAGSNWSSSEGGVAPIPDELAAAMREHEASWAGGPPAPRPEVAVSRGARPPRATLPPAPVDLDVLYAQAEAAMRRRSTDEARRALETIADRDRSGPLGQVALLDLARLALADGDAAEARRILDRLPTPLPDPALADTADHLRCRASRPAGAESDGACPPAR